jgi:hypothetical protein
MIPSLCTLVPNKSLQRAFGPSLIFAAEKPVFASSAPEFRC